MAALAPDAPVGSFTDEHVEALLAFTRKRAERYAKALEVVEAARRCAGHPVNEMIPTPLIADLRRTIDAFDRVQPR
jgi:hypothetical protein